MSGFNMIFGGLFRVVGVHHGTVSRSYLPLAVPSNGSTSATVACSIVHCIFSNSPV